MAISPQALWPSQVVTGDAGYPYGKARNQAVPNDGTGTPLEQNVVNDLFGMQQALLDAVGVVPSGTPDRVGNSQYVAAIRELILRSQAELAALNWPYQSDDTGFTTGYTNDPLGVQIGVAFADNFTQYLLVKSGGAGAGLARTRSLGGDLGVDWEFGSVLPSSHTIDNFFADIDRRTAGGSSVSDVIALASTPGVVYKSTDAGQTWGGAAVLPSATGWTVVHRSYAPDKVIVVGFGKIASSPGDLSGFSSLVMPAGWAGNTPAEIVAARRGESAFGWIVCPANSVLNGLCSADGVTWVSTPLSTSGNGQPVSACWSEPHRKWFVLTQTGRIFSSSSVLGPFTLAATMYAGGTPTPQYYRIRSFGGNLVISCGHGAGNTNTETGNLVVTRDLVTFHPLVIGTHVTPDVGVYRTLQHFDGRLVAASIVNSSPPYGLSLVASLRAPWP